MEGRTGRRPGDSGTREAILAAARRQFGDNGFDRTSLRAIAAEAGVDPALVTHYFGSKQKLFVQVADLPFDPAAIVPGLLAGDRDTVGLRVATFLVGILETDEGRRRITGLVRAAASEPEAARLVRERVARDMLGPIAANIAADEPELRASLMSAQMVGLVMVRYIVAVEPLGSLAPEAVIANIAPNLQRLLTGPIEG